MDDPPASDRAPSVAPPVVRGGVRRPEDGFEREFNAYLHERLSLCVGVLLFVGLLLLGMHSLLAPAPSATYPGYWRQPGTFAHLGGLVGVGLMGLALRRGRWRGRALLAADSLLQVSVLLSCTALYELTYELANRSLVPCFGLLLVTRAVVVPSRAWRTFLGAVPAPFAILAVQLVRGREAFGGPPPMPPGPFLEMAAWDFAYLALCAAIATFASRVNFRLRVSAYEAKRLDQYVLEGLLGKGAMGEVHRARHALMRRPTAIKLVRSDMLTPRLLQRFEQEVRQTSRLTHPNTIRVYDYGQTADGVFYYAMELLEGADLERVVETSGPMPPARAIHVLVQALGALAEAHAIGLVHRDIKPSNLLLCRRGLAHDVVKVMDFGLVRDMAAVEPSLSTAEEVCGSPQTIAPEVVRGAAATPAADLYSLGAVGCWLLTGKPIFDASTVLEFVLAHVQQPPISPSRRGAAVPADLERALLSCLAKEPSDRPASAEALRGTLLACADAGRWTEADAAAWWSGPGAALLTPPDGTGLPRTVGLGHR